MSDFYAPIFMVRGHLMIVNHEMTAWAWFQEQLNRADELTKRRGNFPTPSIFTNFFPTALFHPSYPFPGAKSHCFDSSLGTVGFCYKPVKTH